MHDQFASDGSFEAIEQSEVVTVRCRGCGTDQPINKVFERFVGGSISSCRHCREAAAVSRAQT